ncbi:Fe3+ ABC transporter periplasmic protein [Beauveria bassiana ARSEF 2860]|uniref:Fe3+ ABC transporter periplasmic protein n=1 Tax=Beauveria bassiana (strain ARSEF 2860) TaxID=655819 RepID=J4W120_BEAB2|nr:Fe3+ ABC transporter periplasmic protein [Beauveria bassiana ARSEF 2860]EJP64195.1 Fe3+ ABC transporter periplasmic protein [Beauveria bassiana ARSEF 2860]
MRINKQLLYAVLAAGQSLVHASGTETDTRSIDEIYEAARNESGVLNVYFGGSSQAAAAPLLNAFRSRFPDVEINITAELSKYADSKIDRSYIEGNPFIDVAILQTVQDFARWDKQLRLLHYKPANFDDINLAIKHIDGAYFPVTFNQFGPFYYDSDLVPQERVPTTYADVLDPYWKGKIVLTYPNDDDGVLYLFALIIERYGFQWLDSLLQQDVQWVRGASAATGTIISNHNATNGSRVLTFSGLGGFTPSTSFLLVQRPAPPDRFMTWAQLAGIFASTPRPESAKLFASFLLSDEWQQPIAQTGAPSIRTSLTGDNNVFAANNTEPTGYITFMSNREEVEWWRLQLETSIGLAVGPNPVIPVTPTNST